MRLRVLVLLLAPLATLTSAAICSPASVSTPLPLKSIHAFR